MQKVAYVCVWFFVEVKEIRYYPALVPAICTVSLSTTVIALITVE